MDRRKIFMILAILSLSAVVLLGAAQGIGARARYSKTGVSTVSRTLMKNPITTAQRRAAARRAAAARAANPLLSLTANVRRLAARALGIPDYFGTTPNYANSPLPSLDSTGNVVPGTGMRKFVDSLPGLGASAANDLGQYIPVATPDTTAYAGSDYYVIALVQYTEKLHKDLPATTLRGYVQLNTAEDTTLTPPSYLGPAIVAQKDKPVRVKFINKLAAGTEGNLFLPVDTTVMGAGTGPTGTAQYTQNRATLHLHGGATPWISDGTPHQWTTPAGESTPYPKGVSVSNVPDMPDPGPGALTFYYTNQQSARLMFYHDHSYGITRLNVYAGEAAPYLLNDPAEQELIDGNVSIPIGERAIEQTIQPSTIPTEQVPLVIQDKTFVPDTTQLNAEDPTWDTANWGGEGNLWFPHVYMPNQNPSDSGGVNAMGRWDYAPFIFPPVPTANGPVPNPLAGLPGQNPENPGTPNPSFAPEAFMDTPLVNGTAYPYVKVGRKAYRFRILNASNDRMLNLQLYYAKSDTPDSVDASGNPTLQTDSGDVSMTVAAAHPGDPSWPASWPKDGRDGGVPDPYTAGPEMIQIGNESGFLPKPAALPNQPVDYNYDRKTATVLNVSSKTLYVGPAERADVIIDFSQVPNGAKLILYNDAPAAMPLFDVRYDYYTDRPDMTDIGGTPPTRPGYGPNTRTILQFQVESTAAATSFDATELATALPAAFAASQDPIIVPQKAYGASTDTFAKVQDESLTFKPPGSPTTVTVAMKGKQEVEFFEPQYGRMNAQLGTQLNFTDIMKEIILPFGFIDPPTETITNSDKATPIGSLGDGTQIWRISHNGVDTHVIHFHLFSVQVINRVGFDGMVSMPDANELGWKESVRMNPFENLIVAMRPSAPDLPFKVPDSIRPLDPTQPLGAALNFAPYDTSGNPTVTVNKLTNFGWEYVWHCHLLGHEENDMMRPIVFQVAPAAPTVLTATASPLSSSAPRVNLAWANSATNPAAASFTVQRATNTSFTTNLTTLSDTGTATTLVDTSVAQHVRYYYRVRAENTAAYSPWSNTATALTAGQLPLPRTNLRVTARTTSTISIAWSNPAGGSPASSIRVQRSSRSSGGPWTNVATMAGTRTSYRLIGLARRTRYWIRVFALNADGLSRASNGVSAATR